MIDRRWNVVAVKHGHAVNVEFPIKRHQHLDWVPRKNRTMQLGAAVRGRARVLFGLVHDKVEVGFPVKALR